MTKYCFRLNNLILFLCLMLGLSPTGYAEPEKYKKLNNIAVTDFAGRTVTLSKPAERIIALAPHIVENVYSAGAGHKLVGAVSFSDYPPEAKNIPIVGGYHSFSLEKIAALQPDLVITWAEGDGAEAAKPFENLGIPVYVDEPRELHEVAEVIAEIGQLTGHADIARQVSDQFLQKLQVLKQRYSHKQPVSVFYQVWNEPLMTINHEHLINAVIEVCGGQNIFADSPAMTPKISLEAIIGRDPAAIIAGGMGEEHTEWLDDWRKYKNLSAVRQQHLFFISPSLLQRHTARILLGAEQMCEQLEQVRQTLYAEDT